MFLTVIFNDQIFRGRVCKNLLMFLYQAVDDGGEFYSWIEVFRKSLEDKGSIMIRSIVQAAIGNHGAEN